jgi:hypothetical protein
MNPRQRQEVKDDFFSLKVARKLVYVKLARADTEMKHKSINQASMHLERLDAIKAKADAGRYSQKQLAFKASVGGEDTAFGDLVRGIPQAPHPSFGARRPIHCGVQRPTALRAVHVAAPAH